MSDMTMINKTALLVSLHEVKCAAKVARKDISLHLMDYVDNKVTGMQDDIINGYAYIVAPEIESLRRFFSDKIADGKIERTEKVSHFYDTMCEARIASTKI